VTVARSILLFVLAAVAFGAYGFVATFQPDTNFGRILAAYGGIFVAGGLLWGMLVDGFRPDRWDVWGSAQPDVDDRAALRAAGGRLQVGGTLTTTSTRRAVRTAASRHASLPATRPVPSRP